LTRPAPVVTQDNQGFWNAAADGRLVTQRCRSCGRLSHPPRPVCPDCHSLDQESVDVAGTGAVYSYAVLHHPQNPAFEYPVVAILVDLDEGPRVLSNLVGCAVEHISIGMPVQVRFEPTTDGMAVPVFEPAGGSR
jgi:uncharacterized OB-fold protein